MLDVNNFLQVDLAKVYHSAEVLEMRGALDQLSKLGIEYISFAGRQPLVIFGDILKC